MLYYEFRKIFDKRKQIALLVLLSVISCFFTAIMCQLTTNDNYQILPFEEYLAYYWLYGMSILYFIVFIHVQFFPVEEKNEMLQILLISRIGREKLVKTKIRLALIVTNIFMILFIILALTGYSVAFMMDYKIPIEEYYDTIYAADSCVKTSGSMLFINIISFIITANFTALFSMYLSAKLRNAYLTCVLLFAGCFLTLFSLNPEVGVFFSLTPLGNYIVIADTLEVMFSFGPFSITPHFISLFVTIIFTCILYVKIIDLYKAGK